MCNIQIQEFRIYDLIKRYLQSLIICEANGMTDVKGALYAVLGRRKIGTPNYGKT